LKNFDGCFHPGRQGPCQEGFEVQIAKDDDQNTCVVIYIVAHLMMVILVKKKIQMPFRKNVTE